ncbi:hypothetical protein DV736_g5040, partial [Chaetothyriales sp. CBS 134916]
MAGTLRQPLLPRQSSTTTSSPNTGSASTDQFIELISNPYQAAFQTKSFWASLITYLTLSFALAVLFSIARPRHRLVYAPKTKHADEKHAPPPIGNGILSWIGPVSKASEHVLMDKIGMDAVLFLRFTRMLRNLFALLAVIGLCIMIPVNVTKGADIKGGSGFTYMTPLFVFGNGLWAQVVVAWANNLIICYFLWHNYRRILSLRRAYFESSDYQNSLHARTLLLRDIAPPDRNDEGLLRITDQTNPTGVRPRVTIGRNVRILPDLIEEHEEAVRNLESVLAKYLKNPDRLPASRPMIKPKKGYQGATVNGKVDAIDYLQSRIAKLETQISDVRDQVDKRDAESYGFATWDLIAQAHTVAFAAGNKRHQGSRIQLAPRPSDLIWKNLPLTKRARGSKRTQNAVWISLLTVVWLPLNAAIAIFLSNLSNLGKVWPSFQRQLEGHSTGWAIVQGIAAPSMTALVYLVLPIIFRRLQIRAGDYTKTQREHHVLRNLYTFFTLNNLIIFSIFSALWQFITNVIKEDQAHSTWEAIKKADFFLTVTTSLCQISPFWVSFILQRNLGAALDLAQLWQVTVVWFERTFMAPTPRQQIEWTAPQPFDYASYYNYFLFYTTIALCFSTLQPIILLVSALYFSVDAVMKKYLLMYVFVTKTESGGLFWRAIFNRLVFATILSDIVIAIVVKARGTWVMVGLLLPLLLLMLGLKYYCAKQFDSKFDYYATTTAMHDMEPSTSHGKRPKAEKISKKYGHPALYRPLMTPMVHAKAQHVLADIYCGRLVSDTDNSGFGDVAIPMTKIPSHDVSNPVPFEFVSEAQQEFSYYKNRDDFRDEGGDLYGRPEDLISERSLTPMSLMSYTKHGRAGGTPNLSGETTREHSPHEVNRVGHQIHRKQVSAGPLGVHPTLRLQPMAEGPAGDLGMKHGTYTDPDDDRQNLLSDTRTPNAEFMTLDRWRTGETATPSAYSYDNDSAGGYDYFRGRH